MTFKESLTQFYEQSRAYDLTVAELYSPAPETESDFEKIIAKVYAAWLALRDRQKEHFNLLSDPETII
ncbi:hypothetical protein [Runella sp.]|uniref:hypothetical protein n=1 Tax=Runella sp. TaxID=1960881 RepID=UPI003D0DDACD